MFYLFEIWELNGEKESLRYSVNGAAAALSPKKHIVMPLKMGIAIT